MVSMWPTMQCSIFLLVETKPLQSVRWKTGDYFRVRNVVRRSKAILSAISSIRLTCFNVCFADAKPTEPELTVWNQMEGVLRQTDAILTELSTYRGATVEIRDVSFKFSTAWFSFFLESDAITWMDWDAAYSCPLYSCDRCSLKPGGRW